jgi:hypothetical protein
MASGPCRTGPLAQSIWGNACGFCFPANPSFLGALRPAKIEFTAPPWPAPFLKPNRNRNLGSGLDPVWSAFCGYIVSYTAAAYRWPCRGPSTPSGGEIISSTGILIHHKNWYLSIWAPFYNKPKLLRHKIHILYIMDPPELRNVRLDIRTEERNFRERVVVIIGRKFWFIRCILN